MYIVCNRIGVNAGHEAAFEERFANRAGQVEGMDGFISFTLMRPETDGDPYVVMTTWENKAAFEVWTSSDAFRNQHANSGTLAPETFAGRPKLEYFEVIQATTKASEDA